VAKKKDFKIAEPALQVKQIIEQSGKYKIGEPGYSFYDIKSLKPVFAFDYISLSQSPLCFDNNELTSKDYLGLIEGLKKVSSISYDELQRTQNYRFHRVDFDDPRVSLKRQNFKYILSPKEDLLPDEHLPILYQFDLQYVQAARVLGFIFKGVFYLVWYDRHHKVYP